MKVPREELIRGLVELLESPASSSEPSPYYTQHDSPLGRTRHLELIRSGAIPGYRTGRLVFAKRVDVHAYIESHPVRPVSPARRRVNESSDDARPSGAKLNLFERVRAL